MKILGKKISIGWTIIYLFMIALLLFTALPLIYMISSAFKPIDELFLFPPTFFVRKPTFQNFISLLTTLDSSVVPFTRYVFNSLFTAVAVVGGTVIISSMAAFALSKYKLPGSNWIFAVIVSALMFSQHVTQIPSFLVVSKLGMVNTYWALIIPRLAPAYNVFLIKQFSDQVPNELLESGKIDGAGHWKMFWRIYMPILRPAWSTLVVLSFVLTWNDYFTPLIYISNDALKMLTLALQTLSGGPGILSRSGVMAAATFVTTAPTIIIFTIMQKKVIDTMAYSGIKA